MLAIRNSATRGITALVLVTACTLGVVGCNQLMGIEDAAVDPTLTPSEATTGGGSSAAADGSVDTDSGVDTDTDTDTDSTSTTAGLGSGGGATTGGSDPLGEAGATGSPGSGNDSSASTSTSSGTSGTGGTGQTEPPTLCESYCDDIMELCTGPLLQYRDRAQCLAICDTFPEGTLGKTNENSVACRAKWAGDARYGSGTELEAYCRQAGPSGGGRCGSNCDGLCSIMMNVCTPQAAGVYHFETEEACLMACSELPVLAGGYSASDATIADGNHVECRLFHVMSAAMLDPEEHCEHALGITLCEATTEE